MRRQRHSHNRNQLTNLESNIDSNFNSHSISNATNKPLVVLPDDYDGDEPEGGELDGGSVSEETSAAVAGEPLDAHKVSTENRKVQEFSNNDDYEKAPTGGYDDSSSKYIEASFNGGNSTIKYEDNQSHSKRVGGANESVNAMRNYHEPLGIDGQLISSFFSHIDKQWKFAEIILIIVFSVILDLVTVIGNIMVLISFKMDRT